MDNSVSIQEQGVMVTRRACFNRPMGVQNEGQWAPGVCSILFDVCESCDVLRADEICARYSLVLSMNKFLPERLPIKSYSGWEITDA
jgi:hypothetical protein